jgi:hypothetical protein
MTDPLTAYRQQYPRSRVRRVVRSCLRAAEEIEGVLRRLR